MYYFFVTYRLWILHNAKFMLDLFGFRVLRGLFVLDCSIYNTIQINVNMHTVLCEWSEPCLFYNFIFFLTQFLSACKAAYRSSSWQASCSALAFHGLIVSLCSYSTICIYVPCNLYTERWAMEVPVRWSCQEFFAERMEVPEGLLDT